MGRRLFYAFLFFLAFLAILLGTGKIYLASHARPQVVARLQSALGMPVQVAEADVGISGGSELKGVQVFEPPAKPGEPPPPADKPWFRVERVEADVSVLGLLRGDAMPGKVRLQGVSVYLRFDKDGKLLTHLPNAPSGGKATFPELVIDGGQLTIEQAGRAPFVVAGIHGELKPAGSTWKIAGKLADKYWGDWALGGQVESATSGVTLTLDTPAVDVTDEKLKKVPFVPPSVWQEVGADGKTAARLTLTLSSKADESHCKVELKPADAKIRIDAIALNTAGVRGDIVIDDQLVTLRRVTGRAADGTIGADGKLDFRAEPATVSLDVEARDVSVKQLPASWEFPEALAGKLTGTAKLRLRLTSPVQTEGSSGEGVVTGVALLGLGKGEARIYLHPGPGRIRFRPEPPGQKGAALPVPTVLTGRTLPPDPPTGPGMPMVSQSLDMVSGGLRQAAKAISTGATTSARWMRQMNQPLPPGQQPTYFEANLSLQDVDLAELVQRAKIQLPFAVAGKLSFQVNVGFPVDAPKDFKSYRFSGDAQLPRLTIAGFEMANVRTRIRYADGNLVLETLHAEIPLPEGPAGTLDGAAKYQVVPPGDATANLRLERFPVGAVGKLAPVAAAFRGLASGTLQLDSRGGQLNAPAAWEATARLKTDSLTAYGLKLKDFETAVTLARGDVIVNELKGTFEGAAITGSGKLRLAGNGPFEANLAAPGLDLAFVQRLDPDLRLPVPMQGQVDLTAGLKGTLWPLKYDTAGTVRAANLTVDKVRLSALSFHYTVAAGQVNVTDARADLYRGTVTGTATLPLQANRAGDVALTIKNVDARSLMQDMPAIPVKLDGMVSGMAEAKLPPTTPDKSRDFAILTDLTAPDLRIQGIPTRRVRADVTYRNGAGTYHVEGELAGGTFKLEGPLGARPEAPPPAGPQSGTLQLRDISLGRLAESLSPTRSYSPLRGTLYLNLPFQWSASGVPAGQGTFSITRARWANNILSDRVQGEVRLGPTGIILSDVNSSFAGGELRLRAGYGFGPNGQLYVNLDLFHADAARVLGPIPGLAGQVEGTLDANMRIAGYGELRGSGTVALTRGRIAGIEVADWRIPFDLDFVPGGRGQLEVRDCHGQVARGRAQARVDLTWGDATRLDAKVRFIDADLRGIAGRDSEVSTYASGQLSGTLDLGSDNLQSANDLNGVLNATLKQAQANGVPVLQQLIPFMGLIGGSGATRFQSGEIQGRLARGTFRVQRFTLYGSVTQVMMQGDVTLAGRLDLEATLGTNNFGPSSRSLALLGLRIPAFGPIPLALILDATALLANRIVHLRITGTLASPNVRVEPTALLSEEAIRFFLSRTGLPVTP